MDRFGRKASQPMKGYRDRTFWEKVSQEVWKRVYFVK
jgi:hypothetical protein